MVAFASPGELAPATIPDALVVPSGIVPFYVSTHGITTHPGDTPANTHFDGRMLGDITYRRSIVAGDRFGGRAALGFGDLDLWNGDGFLDTLYRDYAIDGRLILLKSGRFGDHYGAYQTVFSGTADVWRPDGDFLVLRLRDATWRLEVPAQQTFYGGTGGLDGGDDLAGKPKPLSYGAVFNVPAVLVDQANQIYQVHDGRIQSIDAVRVRGALMAQVPSAPSIGQYTVDLAHGTFTLGFQPDGAVTADVEGDATGDLYVSSTATILDRLLATRGGFAEAELDGGSLAQLAFDAPAEVGLWQGTEPALVADLVDRLMAGVGGFAGPSRAGLFQAGVLKAPSSAANFTLDEDDIIEVDELELPTFAAPPPQRVTVGWKQNYAPSTDLAGAVSGDDRAALSNQWRVGAAFFDAVATAYATSQQPAMIEGLFSHQADAETEAARLGDLYGPGRRLYQVTTDRYPGQVELGMTALVTHPDKGLAQGRLLVVVDWAEDMVAETIALQLYG